VACGNFFLMISTTAWKSLRKNPLRLSHSFHSARDRKKLLIAVPMLGNKRHNILITPRKLTSYKRSGLFSKFLSAFLQEAASFENSFHVFDRKLALLQIRLVFFPGS